MQSGTIIALSAAGFILYSLFRKGSALNTLLFFPHSIKNIRFEGVTPIMTFGLAIQNTSNQKFIINSIAGQIFSNKYLIGNIGNFTRQQITPNSQNIIFVSARLSLIGIVSDIIAAINNNTFTQELELEMKANIDGLQIPIDLKYKFGK